MVAAIENPYSQPPRLSHVDFILGRTGINPAMPGRELKGHRHLDFVSDSLANGRRIKCLTIADDFTRECIDIAVDLSMPGAYVTRILDQAARFRGYPEAIRTDNGPEFTCRAFMAWMHIMYAHV